MARLLRQLVEAAQVVPPALPHHARQKHHRGWPGRKHHWQALQATVMKTGAQQPGGVQQDNRLREARHWYECAYEWRLVSYAMHAHARLNAEAESKILFYIPSDDVPSICLS